METGANLALVAAKADVVFIAASLLLRHARSEPLLLGVSAIAKGWRQQEKDAGAPEEYLLAFDAVLGDLLVQAQAHDPSQPHPPA